MLSLFFSIQQSTLLARFIVPDLNFSTQDLVFGHQQSPKHIITSMMKRHCRIFSFVI